MLSMTQTCGHMHLLTPTCTHVLTNSLKYPFTHTSAPVYIHQLTTTPSAPTNSPQLREHNAPAALELQNCRQLLQRSELGQGQA